MFVKEARGTEVSRILRGLAFDIIVIGATADLLLPIKASVAPSIPLASFTSIAMTRATGEHRHRQFQSANINKILHNNDMAPNGA